MTVGCLHKLIAQLSVFRCSMTSFLAHEEECCIICMTEPATAKLEPCGHMPTCHDCTLPALFCAGLHCPLCRELVLTLSSEQFHKTKTQCIKIVPSDTIPHVGVTLKNSKNGVVVSNLSKNELGVNVLKIGNVIRAINGIPAVHHRTMVSLIDACSKTKTCMHIELTTEKEKISTYLRRLAAKYHDSRDSFHPEWYND